MAKTTAASTTIKTAKASKKDSKEPKRPCSAYALYSKDMLSVTKTNMPEGTKQPDVMREVGKLWKQLGEAEKKVYEARAKEEKEKYTVAMKQYKASQSAPTPPSISEPSPEAPPKKGKGKTKIQEVQTEPPPESTTNKKSKKKEIGIKKPLTPYFLYCADKREGVKKANPDAKVTEISKVLGAWWKAESEEVQNKYKAQFEANKKRYEAEVAALEK